jgi:hypothetical protein
LVVTIALHEKTVCVAVLAGTIGGKYLLGNEKSALSSDVFIDREEMLWWVYSNFLFLWGSHLFSVFDLESPVRLLLILLLRLRVAIS